MTDGDDFYQGIQHRTDEIVRWLRSTEGRRDLQSFIRTWARGRDLSPTDVVTDLLPELANWIERGIV